MIDGKSFFDNPIKIKEEASKKIIEIGRNKNYKAGNLLDYEYFSKNYKLIAIDLGKQIGFKNHNLKKQVNHINLIGRFDRDDGAAMFFII